MWYLVCIKTSLYVLAYVLVEMIRVVLIIMHTTRTNILARSTVRHQFHTYWTLIFYQCVTFVGPEKYNK